MFKSNIENHSFFNRQLKFNLPRTQGFTLIELMIVVAIVGILATIAYPSYQQYIIRSNRVAAQSQMMEIANLQQQFLIANRTFADSTTLSASGFSLPPEVSRHYDFAVTLDEVATQPRYLITFTPKANQSTDGTLTLDSNGTKSPLDKW
jgi:type IV pilus assembly protein PilE